MSDSGSHERHLLFGLLAFQNEFVSHSDLLKAFSTWIADKSKTLDQILVEQGVISEEDRQLFARLVEKHSAKFGGDVRETLCNLSDLDSIRDELENLAANDPIAINTLSHMPVNHVQASRYQTIFAENQLSAPQQAPTYSSSRFRIVRQHARGGLGVVFVAEDQDLRREVAMKQIRDDRADYEEYRIKFVHEAEVTGQLEHPGIVPVYALGVDAKGRPYYAMRFVRGEDLQTRIRSFHANRSLSKLGFDGSELRGLMRRYIDICNAIQYAHDRGVLHRDLKPGNVMLGKHGETLVVDWGLAKAIGDPNELDPTATVAPDTELPVGRSGTASGTETQAGTFIGTPAYAPPEQVLGQLEKLGPRSDVYSLGAILYELLTGKVPVSGTTVAEVITNATTGNYPAPRNIDAAIPKALEAICRRAMEVDPADRYASASMLRSDVENWLDDTPVAAYSEPWLGRLQRKIRKNPVIASWTAAVVLMTLLATAGYGIVSSNYNRQLMEKNQLIVEEKSAAEKARDAEELAKNAAVLAQSQAVGVRDFIVDIFRQPDPSRDGRTVTVYDSMVSGVRRVRRDFGNDPQTAIALLTAIYQSYNSLGLYKDANELIEEVLEIRKSHNLESTDAALENRNDLGKNLKLLGKYPQSIQVHETLYQLCFETRGANNDLTLQIKHDLANAYRAAGRLQDALKANQEVFAARKRVLGDDDPNLLSSQNTLANSLQAIGQLKEALTLRKVNFAAREKSLGPNHPDTLSSQNNLALALLETGNTAESLEVLTAAYAQRRKVLGLDHPDTLASLLNLANVLFEMGKNDRMEEMYSEAIAGLTTSLGADHPSTLAATAGRGRALELQGEFARAVTLLSKVHQAQVASLGESHPNTLAVVTSLANSLEMTGEIDQARQMLEEAVSRSLAAFGESNELTVDLQLSLSALYFEENERELGMALCEKLVLTTTEAFGATHPKAIKARNNLALAYFIVGDLQNALSNYEALEMTEIAALGPLHRETIRTALGKILTLRQLKRTAIALAQAEQVLAHARQGLGETDSLTLDALGAAGQLYLIDNRPADAKPLLYEEYQSRQNKFGFTELPSILAASYLITACEQLEDWTTVKTVSQRLLDELAGREADAVYVADFQFRLGHALASLQVTSESAEQLMLDSWKLVEERGAAIAPPLLSPLEMENRLHRFYVSRGELEKAKAYSAKTKKVPLDID